ncbi:hypothetical protein K2173_009063 [Erythroxylum novogranatense]|uniref:AP2/ERF domain-containing protein n=1 Tax=Erythroxylum novogranatense TaxID=1862640 RepID=A0AAV8TU13_9ROSI|nr:hypothetical protein K2173_009063 [Erythroxylum novogranatense]
MINANDMAQEHQKKYKGVRRRKWGKWVSETRVPGTQERLWLGTYTTPVAAAVAYDVALYCLRGESSVETLNFPDLKLPASVRGGMSPRSIQKAASDAGMAIDAQMILSKSPEQEGVSSTGIGEMAENGREGCGVGDENELKEGEDSSLCIDDYLY